MLNHGHIYIRRYYCVCLWSLHISWEVEYMDRDICQIKQIRLWHDKNLPHGFNLCVTLSICLFVMEVKFQILYAHSLYHWLNVYRFLRLKIFFSVLRFLCVYMKDIVFWSITSDCFETSISNLICTFPMTLSGSLIFVATSFFHVLHITDGPFFNHNYHAVFCHTIFVYDINLSWFIFGNNSIGI